MKHLQVTFNVHTKKGKAIKIEVCVSIFGLYIVSDENVVNWLNKTGSISKDVSNWQTNNCDLWPYMPGIRERFFDVIDNFKWKLPKRMKDAIYGAEIDCNESMITIDLENFIDAKVFTDLLRRHLLSRQIKPLLPVTIDGSPHSDVVRLDLGVKPKQRWPDVPALTTKDLDKLGSPVADLKK